MRRIDEEIELTNPIIAEVEGELELGPGLGAVTEISVGILHLGVGA